MKRSKRALSSLLALLMLVSLFSGLTVTASAAGAAAFVVESGEKTVDSNGDITVTVSVENNPGFTWAYLQLNYSASAMTLKNVQSVSSAYVVSLGNNGIIELMPTNDDDNFTGNGPLFTMTFTAVKNGDVQVALKCREDNVGNITDVNGNAVPFAFTNGTITIGGLHVAATSVTLNKTELLMAPGASETLTAVVAPKDNTETLSWASSDPDVVSVEDGLVTAHALGSAVITAAAGDASASCTITVVEPTPEKNADGYYEIGNVKQLQWLETNLSELELPVNVLLTADITDYAGVIGSSTTPYIGTFDGNGHTITAKYYYGGGSGILRLESGLFSVVGDASGAYTTVIKNLTRAGSHQDRLASYHAGIAGVAYGTVRFENCVNAASVSGNYGQDTVGGILGVARADSVVSFVSCVNEGIVGGQYESAGIVGGIVGHLYNSTCTIDRCENRGNVGGSAIDDKGIGGIVGCVRGTSSLTVVAAMNSGRIMGNYVPSTNRGFVGDIVGNGQSGTTINLKSCVSVAQDLGSSFRGTRDGIIAGKDAGTVENCYSRAATKFGAQKTVFELRDEALVTLLNTDGTYFYFNPGGYPVYDPALATIGPAGIRLDKSTATVTAGENVKITAEILPAECTDTFIQWTSSDGSVATVSGGGVHGWKSGTVTITATTANGYTASCTVTVLPKPETVTLSSSTLTVCVTETGTLTAVVGPEGADQTVVWTSSDESIATVENGVVTGVAEGRATITATAGSVSGSCTVTVKPAMITMSASSIKLAPRETSTLTAQISPAAMDQTVVWTSSDERIATVENGVVTAVAEGRATITAASAVNSSLTATCKVTVAAAGPVEDTSVVIAETDWFTFSADKTTAAPGENVTFTVEMHETVTDKTAWVTLATVDDIFELTNYDEGFQSTDQTRGWITQELTNVYITEMGLTNSEGEATDIAAGTYQFTMTVKDTVALGTFAEVLVRVEGYDADWNEFFYEDFEDTYTLTVAEAKPPVEDTGVVITENEWFTFSADKTTAATGENVTFTLDVRDDVTGILIAGLKTADNVFELTEYDDIFDNPFLSPWAYNSFTNDYELDLYFCNSDGDLTDVAAGTYQFTLTVKDTVALDTAIDVTVIFEGVDESYEDVFNDVLENAYTLTVGAGSGSTEDPAAVLAAAKDAAVAAIDAAVGEDSAANVVAAADAAKEAIAAAATVEDVAAAQSAGEAAIAAAKEENAALAAAKDEAKADVNAAAGEERSEAMQAIVDAALEAIDAAEDTAALDAAVEEAMAAIAAQQEAEAEPKELAILTQPESVICAMGDTVTFTVEAEGNGLTYTWYYKNPARSKFTALSVTDSNSYTITMTDARNGRQMYCVVRDEYGNFLKSEVATMALPTLTITQQPTSVVCNLNSTANFTVAAEGTGELTYQWYYKNPTASKFTAMAIGAKNSYAITMEAKRNGRQMYCVVRDTYGNAVKSDVVTMTMPELVIVSQPESVTCADGEKATFTVIAEGEGLTYTWYYKNPRSSKFTAMSASEKNTYTITMNSARDGRQMYCVIRDANGQKLTTETVTMTTAH